MADVRPFSLVTVALLLTTLLAVLLIPSGTTSAQDHFVGLVGSTHTSVQLAIDQALPGDTIYIANGTYNENITIYKPGLSLIGNGSVVITTELNRPTVLIQADWVNLTNIEVRSWNASGQEAVYVRNCENVNVSGCQIYNSNPSGYGMLFYNTSLSNVFDCFIFKNESGGGGVYCNADSDNLTIENCNIYVNGTFGLGIYSYSIWTRIIGSDITTMQKVPGTDTYSYGVLMRDAHNSTIIGNSFITTGRKSHAIYIYQNPDNRISDNDVITTGFNSLGINIFDSHRTDVFSNTVDTWGATSYGIHLLYSEYCQVNDNNIETHHFEMLTTSSCHGIYLYNCEWVEVDGNDIVTNGKSSHGTYSYISSNNTYASNQVQTYHTIWNVDSGSHGIAIVSCWDEQITGNTIITHGRACIGIYIKDSFRGEVDHNTIETYGYYVGVSSNSDAILLVSSTKQDVHHNILTTNGRSSFGIETALFGNNDLHNNTIDTSKESASGIYLNTVEDVTVLDNTINVVGGSASGISAYLSSALIVGRNDIFSTGFGIYIPGSAIVWDNQVTSTESSAFYVTDAIVNAWGNEFISQNGYSIVGVNEAYGTFTDCILSSGSDSYDVVLNGDTNFTMINCTLDNSKLLSKYAGGGVIQVQNYFEAQVFFEDNVTPLAGADVEIKDNEEVLYASSGFGGTDPVLDANGWIGRFLVADAWWVYDGIPTQNITTVNLSYQGDKLWTGSYSIDMSDSKLKRIIAGDMIVPPAPFNIQAETVLGTNLVNVTWDYTSPDMEYFKVFKDSGSGFIFEMNTTQTYFLDTNLSDNETAGYKVLAVDDGPNESPFTLPVYIEALDITPPETPLNLTVFAPNTGGEVQVTWELNTDDTVFYILYRDNIEIFRTLLSNYNDLDVDDGKYYHYSISAVDDAGLESEISPILNITPLDLVAPDVVIGLRLVKLTNNSVEFTWTPSVGASEYLVFSNGSYLKTVTSARAIFSGLDELSFHSFQVVAIDISNNSAKLSDHLNITVPDWTPPGSLEGFSQTYVGYVLVRLKWQSVIDAEYYMVYIDNGTGFDVLSSTQEVSVVASDLIPDTLYEFYVEAFDRVNNSVVSQVLTVRTLLAPPTVIDRYPEGLDFNTNLSIMLIFDQSMDKGSVESSFKLSSVPGTYAWYENDTIMIFTPERPLVDDMPYTVELSTAAKNSQGTNLLENVLWVFTTKEGTPTTPISDDDDIANNSFNWIRVIIIVIIILVILAVLILAIRLYRSSEDESEYDSDVTDITKELKFHKENPPEELMNMNLKEMEESLALEEEMLQLRQKEFEQMGKDPTKIVATLDDDDFDVNADMENLSIDDLMGPYGSLGGDMFDPDANNCPICKKEIGPYDAYCDDCQKFGLNLDTIPCPFCGHDNSWTASKCLGCSEDL